MTHITFDFFIKNYFDTFRTRNCCENLRETSKNGDSKSTSSSTAAWPGNVRECHDSDVGRGRQRHGPGRLRQQPVPSPCRVLRTWPRRRGDQPRLDGTTVLTFAAGTGKAVFDNLIFKGGLKSTKLRFRLIQPPESDIAPVFTETINFLPGLGGNGKSQGTCGADEEGSTFGRNVATNDQCNYVCMAPCYGLMPGMAPECHAATCDNYSVCTASDGCQCDLESIPDMSTLTRDNFITGLTCSPEKIEIRLSKCLINKLGLKLEDLYLNGPEIDFDFSNLGSSPTNTCRGQLPMPTGQSMSSPLPGTSTSARRSRLETASRMRSKDSSTSKLKEQPKRSKFLIDFTCDALITTSENSSNNGTTDTRLG